MQSHLFCLCTIHAALCCPATFELIALVWTSRTLFCNRKGRDEILPEPCALFHHTFFSACNKEARHETTDYRDSRLNVACTCTCNGNQYKDRPWSLESWNLLDGLIEEPWSLDFFCSIRSHTPLFRLHILKRDQNCHHKSMYSANSNSNNWKNLCRN